MARKGTKKDTYWHNIAKLGLSNGLKPAQVGRLVKEVFPCLLYTSPSPRDVEESRMPSSA